MTVTILPSLARWIERAAATLGAVVLVIYVGGQLLAASDVRPLFDREALAAITGKDYEVRFGLVNANNFGDAHVALQSDDHSVRLHPSRVTIRSGNTANIVAIGRARDVGASWLSIQVTIHGGYLRRSRALNIRMPLTIWPSEKFGPFSVLNIADRGAVLRSTLELGRPALRGLNCQASIAHADDAAIVGVAPAVSQYTAAGPISDRRASSVRWAMPAVESFQSVDIFLFTTGQPEKPAPDWMALASRITWRCDRE